MRKNAYLSWSCHTPGDMPLLLDHDVDVSRIGCFQLESSKPFWCQPDGAFDALVVPKALHDLCSGRICMFQLLFAQFEVHFMKKEADVPEPSSWHAIASTPPCAGVKVKAFRVLADSLTPLTL